MPHSLGTSADSRRLSSLGRHLQRSVLAVCLPSDLLRELVPSAGTGKTAVLDAACRLAAGAGAGADRLEAALNAQHSQAIRALQAETDYNALRVRWLELAGTAHMPGTYWALLTHPLADRTLRHLAYGDVEMLRLMREPEAPLARLLERRSVAPRRLGLPAPSAGQIDLMVQAALSGPDHGRLRPWRVIEFGPPTRDALADLFEQEKRRRDPLATAADLRKAREHAVQPPSLLAFVVSPRQRKRVPEREQILAAGAALGNLLNAANALGYGAIVLSGDRCFDAGIASALRLGEGEMLAGFVSIGSVLETPPDLSRPLSQEVWTCWQPARSTTSSIAGESP